MFNIICSFIVGVLVTLTVVFEYEDYERRAAINAHLEELAARPVPIKHVVSTVTNDAREWKVLIDGKITKDTYLDIEKMEVCKSQWNRAVRLASADYNDPELVADQISDRLENSAYERCQLFNVSAIMFSVAEVIYAE